MVNLTLDEAARMAENACLSLTEVQARLLDALENSSLFMQALASNAETVDAIMQTQLATLDRIQYETCPALLERIRAGEIGKLADLQRLIRNATQASQDLAVEYSTFFTIPGAAAYLIGNSFTVGGTILEETTQKIAGFAFALAGLGLVLYLMK